MKSCYTGEMETVAVDMANLFMEGTGTEYAHDVLTKNIASHENTDAYANSVATIINNYIQENNGDISGLAYNAENREDCVMVKRMKDKIYSPIYKEPLSGLGICVDSLYGNRFEIISYKFDGKNYEYTLKFTFYDIFGLNMTDIAPEKMQLFEYGDIQGFRSWYILQHYDLYEGAYQPLI